MLDSSGKVWTDGRLETLKRERKEVAAREYASLPTVERDFVDEVMDAQAAEARITRALKKAKGGGASEGVEAGLRDDLVEAGERVSIARKRLSEYREDVEADREDATKENDLDNRFVPATPEERKALRIPPAWTDVMIDRDPEADLIVTGYDTAGRKQYKYSERRKAINAAKKFARIEEMVARMPQVDEALSRDAGDSDTALAALMIRRMGLRPGSDRDTRSKEKAHGATNLRKDHVEVTGDTVRLRFVGKKAVNIDVSIEDAEIAGHLRRRLEGERDGDRLLKTDDVKVRNYVASIAPGVRPKDFRTLLATSTARYLVSTAPVPGTRKAFASQRREIGKAVSGILGNTPQESLNSYIAPSVFAAWEAALKSRENSIETGGKL